MRPRLKPLREQTIVITGASSGNGLATAQEAVRRGAAVVLAARSVEALQRVEKVLTAQGGRVAICPADVSTEENVEQIARVAVERFGGFDSWVNVAGAATYGRIEDIPLEDHRRIFDVNYFGLLKGSLVAAKHLRARGGGAIVNMGSVLSDRAMILQGPYSASKAAVQAATDALRMELEKEGAPISVTLIKPGSIDTPSAEHAQNAMEAAPRLPPLLYDPGLVADAILFACETPRRHLYVGGSGYLVSLIGRVAPRLTDLAMETFGVEAQQKPAADADAEGGHGPEPSGGRVRGDNDLFVRRTSFLLEAQKAPWALPFLAAAFGAETLQRLSERARERRPAPPILRPAAPAPRSRR